MFKDIILPVVLVSSLLFILFGIKYDPEFRVEVIKFVKFIGIYIAIYVPLAIVAITIMYNLILKTHFKD